MNEEWVKIKSDDEFTRLFVVPNSEKEVGVSVKALKYVTLCMFVWIMALIN